MSIRVLIVDDSRIVRAILTAALRHFSDIEIVGEAGDGARAEQLVKELRPDVVTMDVLMPLMGGLETIAAIMAERPTPIVVVANLEDAAETLAMEALAQGAIAVFAKPPRGLDEAAARELAELLRMSARMRLRKPGPARQRRPSRMPVRRTSSRIIGIVSSSGGPRVLRSILKALPRAPHCPIAIVQHTTRGASEPLARWLSTVSGHAVTVARDGQELVPGQVVVAPDDAHLLITSGLTTTLEYGARIAAHRPSGTVLLKSIAQSFRAQSIGIVLSGMGSDGSEGAAQIEAAGGVVLVEDPATAVVSSMPAETLSRTHEAIIESADELGPALLRLIGAGAR